MPTLSQLLEALKLDPEDPVTHFSLGNAYRDSGQNDRAIEHYRSAVQYKADYSAAWFELARTAERAEDWDVAAEAYRGAMSASRGAGDDHILNAARVRLERIQRRRGGAGT